MDSAAVVAHTRAAAFGGGRGAVRAGITTAAGWAGAECVTGNASPPRLFAWLKPRLQRLSCSVLKKIFTFDNSQIFWSQIRLSPPYIDRGGVLEASGDSARSVPPQSLDLKFLVPDRGCMGALDGERKRQQFRWPKEARELVRGYQEGLGRSDGHHETERQMLITKLTEVSGNPRDACLRFLRQLGVNEKRNYRPWTKAEQQRLLELITVLPVEEVAKILRRPSGSVRSMLHRLGMGGRTGRDWFTKFSLSRALHTRPDEIQKWIELGWLKSRKMTTAGVQAQVIYSDDFCEFVKRHGHKVVGRRLTYDALWFVQNYVFPPSHAELLSVRGTYNKQRGTEERDIIAPSVSQTSEEGESGT
jgi:hypothetical protein